MVSVLVGCHGLESFLDSSGVVPVNVGLDSLGEFFARGEGVLVEEFGFDVGEKVFC